MGIDSNKEENEVQLDASNKAERRTLKQALGINMFQVVMVGTVGFTWVAIAWGSSQTFRYRI